MKRVVQTDPVSKLKISQLEAQVKQLQDEITKKNTLIEIYEKQQLPISDEPNLSLSHSHSDNQNQDNTEVEKLRAELKSLENDK